MENFCPVKIKQCVRNSILSSVLSYTTGRIALHVSPETTYIEETLSVCLIVAFILLQCWISMRTIKSAPLLRDRYERISKSRICEIALKFLEPFCWCSNSLFTGYLAGLLGRLICQWSGIVYVHVLLGNYLIVTTFVIFYAIPEQVLFKKHHTCITIVLSAHMVCYIIFAEKYHLFLGCRYVAGHQCDSSLFYFENVVLQICVTLGVFVLFSCYFIEYKIDRESPTKHWELCLKFIFIPVRMSCSFVTKITRDLARECS